jgi:hypothetical protein
MENYKFYNNIGTVPDLGSFVFNLLSWRRLCYPGPVHVGFVVDKVVLGQVFLQLLLFYPVSIIPQISHIHSFIYQRRCINLAIDNVFK